MLLLTYLSTKNAFQMPFRLCVTLCNFKVFLFSFKSVMFVVLEKAMAIRPLACYYWLSQLGRPKQQATLTFPAAV